MLQVLRTRGSNNYLRVLLYPTISINILLLQYIGVYPTETLVARAMSRANPKTAIMERFSALVFRREIVTQPSRVGARQQAKKKNIDNNRYDYSLHATQDDKHHDNARTN